MNQIIEALKKPETYPHPVDLKIEVIQTQMSVVFLTGQYAYKVKKPVNLGYLDYSTLEQRSNFCNRELELNRRLCSQTYLEVAPISIKSGKVSLGGDAEIVDYAVKMRQLPRNRMMDRLIVEHAVSPEMVRAVAVKLVDFHSKAETSHYINDFGKLCAIVVNTEENFTQTEKYIGISIQEEQFRKIKDYTDSFLRSHSALMHDRIEQGRIRDCHGDLHAAHVCFTDDICIYDCIEFNDRFRYADVASEVAFLAMDLDRYQRPDLSRHFVDSYVEASGDLSLSAVLPFYKCYRAYVRGKVESFKLDDAYLPTEDKANALKNARRYFKLALTYASKAPTLIIMVGLVGTGKTTVAESLSQKLGIPVISSDVTRKLLAGIQPSEHRYEDFHGGVYSTDFSRKTYDAVFEEARQRLAQGESVILDASFQHRADRDRARALASNMSSRFLAIECVLPEDEARRRLEQRIRQVSASDGRWEVYVKQKTTFDSVSELSGSEHIIVDTSGNWNKALARIVEKTDP